MLSEILNKRVHLQHSVAKGGYFAHFASQVLHWQAVLILKLQIMASGGTGTIDTHICMHTHTYAHTHTHTHTHLRQKQELPTIFICFL